MCDSVFCTETQTKWYMTVKRNSMKKHPQTKHLGLGDPQNKSNANSRVRLITNNQKEEGAIQRHFMPYYEYRAYKNWRY